MMTVAIGTIKVHTSPRLVAVNRALRSRIAKARIRRARARGESWRSRSVVAVMRLRTPGGVRVRFLHRVPSGRRPARQNNDHPFENSEKLREPSPHVGSTGTDQAPGALYVEDAPRLIGDPLAGRGPGGWPGDLTRSHPLAEVLSESGFHRRADLVPVGEPVGWRHKDSDFKNGKPSATRRCQSLTVGFGGPPGTGANAGSHATLLPPGPQTVRVR